MIVRNLGPGALPRALRSTGLAVSAIGLVALGGCASFIPNDGPMLSEVQDEAMDNKEFGFDLIAVNPAVIDAVEGHSPAPVPHLFPGDKPVSLVIGRGDILSITVYQAGVGGPFSAPTQGTATTGGGSAAFTVPAEMVDENGEITFPYSGRVQVAGRTPLEVQKKLEQDLADKLVEPQVVVGISDNESNQVTLAGAVHSPGRPRLTPAGTTLLQLISAAGGPTQLPSDTIIDVTRGDHTETVAMEDLVEHPEADVRLRPNDFINLVVQPRTCLIFGATGKVNALPLGARRMTLAETLALSGGTLDERGDRRAVLVFRFEHTDILQQIPGARIREPQSGPEQGLTPVIYKFDIGTAEGYFLAMKFAIRNHDMVFTPNAPEVQWQKFLDMIRVSITPVTASSSAARAY
jgi:polysaccharide export outer membrane protein